MSFTQRPLRRRSGDRQGNGAPGACWLTLQRNLVLYARAVRALSRARTLAEARRDGPTLRHPWPKYDPALAKEDEVEIAVQVNGKVRSRIVVSADAPEDQVREAALTDDKVVAAMEGKQPVKAIVVPGKLVNIVVKVSQSVCRSFSL